jgi:hypothetical protein
MSPNLSGRAHCSSCGGEPEVSVVASGSRNIARPHWVSRLIGPPSYTTSSSRWRRRRVSPSDCRPATSRWLIADRMQNAGCGPGNSVIRAGTLGYGVGSGRHPTSAPGLLAGAPAPAGADERGRSMIELLELDRGECVRLVGCRHERSGRARRRASGQMEQSTEVAGGPSQLVPSERLVERRSQQAKSGGAAPRFARWAVRRSWRG